MISNCFVLRWGREFNIKLSFEELATIFEDNGAVGAEKAVEKLTCNLVEAGVFMR